MTSGGPTPAQDASSWPVRRACGWRTRLFVRLRRRDLDREIADRGASSEDDPACQLRARQLRSRSEREAIAASLANILDAAAECEADSATRLALDHTGVLAARDDIVELIALMRSDDALDARGIARARLLIEDPRGLLVCPRIDQTLQQAITQIARSL